MRCGGSTGPIFTLAVKGPVKPLKPGKFGSKTEWYSSIRAENLDRMSGERRLSGSIDTLPEVGGVGGNLVVVEVTH